MEQPHHHPRRATLVGGIAVLLWSLLALITSATSGILPFQLLAMTFAVAAATGLLALGFGLGGGFPSWRQPVRVWLAGTVGLFGYHFFYFVALGNAPTVDASLIAYLWPVLIVLFSALLPGGHVRWYHVGGVLLGLGGAALLVTRGGGLSLDPRHLLGYAAAAAAALTWAGYSVLNRFFGRVPTGIVGGYCLAAAVLGLGCHRLLEQTVMPVGAQWLAVVALGAGPMGASFFAWDHGTKHGDLPVLGALSYAAPLLSTLLLVAFGRADASVEVAAACLLIVVGAVLAAQQTVLPTMRRLLARRRPTRPWRTRVSLPGRRLTNR